MNESASPAHDRVVLGIDVGGTFTDVIGAAPSQLVVRKTPSRPDAPGEDVIEGIRLVAADLGYDDVGSLLTATRFVFHGSTVATNALLTASEGPVGLITTEGFRDIVEMRGGVRERTFDSRLANAPPLAPRRLRLEATEEVDRDGTVVTTVDGEQVAALARRLRASGASSLAIAFKHAHANRQNELDALAAARGVWPDGYMTVSTELVSRARLYDRVSSAVVNSYVGPKTRRYLEDLRRRLHEMGFAGHLLVMSGNGGVITVDEAAARPSTLILSGPSAGPTAGRRLLHEAGYRDGLVVDMGGTSFDVSLLRGGEIQVIARSDVNRYRLGVPMLDIQTIGAGGGSIASVDDAGLVQVGPRSAGAVPGPASYGLGGTEPTVTDASVVLGYLPHGSVLGQARTLDGESAAAAVRWRVAEPLGLSVEEAAAGIHAVVTANMAAAMREITVGKGVDPTGMAVVVGGGAGALHAARLADELGFGEVLVPWNAGVLCALGMVHSDIRYDTDVSLVAAVDTALMARLPEIVERSKLDLSERLADIGDDLLDQRFRFECELRYDGQFHELTVPVPETDLVGGDPTRLVSRFADAHLRAYGFISERSQVELVDLRATVIGRLRRDDGRMSDPSLALVRSGSRRLYLDGGVGWVDAARFVPGPVDSAESVVGPAIVDLPTTSVLVPPAWQGRLHGSALRMTRR